MAITVEIVGSRETSVSVDDPQQDLVFIVDGTDDELLACQQVENDLTPTVSLVSAFFGTLTLCCQSYKITHRGNGVWDGSAHYGRRKPRQTGDVVLTFDGTGGTQHIQFSKETIESYEGDTDTSAIPDYQNAIGVNDQSVAGVDITVPVYKVTLEYYPATALVTSGFITGLLGLAGCTNDADWTFQPTNFAGPVVFEKNTALFLGATGQPRSLDDWQLLMHFIIGQNAEGSGDDDDEDPGNLISVGDITGIAKKAHDYLWIQFANAENANNLIKVPKYAFVERVYDEGNFASTIGFGI
jgi:hypothetical protein